MIKKKLKSISLVVFDLDGTLLDNNGKIGAESKRLINELRKLDVHFTFASGRLHSSLKEYAEELNIRSPIISLNGALIKNDVTVYQTYFPNSYIKRAIKLSDNYVTNIALCHSDNIYYTEQNLLVPEVLDFFGSSFEMVPSYTPYYSNTLEIVIIGDNKDGLKAIKNKFQFPYTFGLKTSFYKSHRMGGVYLLEISKARVSKTKGLKRLLKYMKLKESETVVLGDWYNDIDLFQTSVLKVALANAVPDIERLADIITEKSNDEDGAAEFLEQLLTAKLNK